jgi:hypothetical protein
MILAALFALAALAFLLLSIGVAVWVWFTLRYALRTEGWATTQGAVGESVVVSNRRCNGLPGHHYRISVDFKLRKREYVCKRVRMGDFRYLTRGHAERVARKYSPGAPVVVHYDAAFVPDHPDREPVVLLEPGLNPECLYPVAVLSLALAGLAFCGASALARIQG